MSCKLEENFRGKIMKKIIFTIIPILLFSIFTSAQSENSKCPSIIVTAPGTVVQEGEIMFFSASVGNEEKNFNVKYKWTVDKGTIINGQGTTTIQVSTEGLSDTTVTATFEIEGLPEVCAANDSDTGVIAPKLPDCSLDEYGKLSLEDEMTRFDAYLADLSFNPQLEIFVQISTDKDESFTDVKKHIRKLVKYIKEREIAPNRVIFAITKSENRMTRIWRVPLGAEMPKCEDCEIFKGSDLK